MTAGDRVRVRPGTGAWDVVAGFAETGTVEVVDGEHLTVRLDSGEYVSATRAEEWEVMG